MASQTTGFLKDVLRRVDVSGVRQVSVATGFPLRLYGNDIGYWIEGQPEPQTPGDWPGAVGQAVGEVTSAAYGHTVGGIVALGYAATGGARVDDAWLAARFEIDIAGERVKVAAGLKAPYDPAGAKLKG